MLFLLFSITLAVGANTLMPCKNQNMDAVMMFDQSQSITQTEFEKLISNYTVGKGPTDASFSGVTFNEKIGETWPLNAFNDLGSLLARVDQIKALQHAYEVLKQGTRPCKAAFLFSDGWTVYGSHQQIMANKIRNDLQGSLMAVGVEGINGYLDPINTNVLRDLSGGDPNLMIKC